MKYVCVQWFKIKASINQVQRVKCRKEKYILNNNVFFAWVIDFQHNKSANNNGTHILRVPEITRLL